MKNRLCFEAFDRTLRDIIKIENEVNGQKPFGDKVIVLEGYFRKKLHVVKEGSRYNVVKSAINYFDLWQNCKDVKLSQNMRLNTAKCNKSAKDIKKFVD